MTAAAGVGLPVTSTIMYGHVEMITAIGRISVEWVTDYQMFQQIDLNDPSYEPALDPKADETPMLSSV